MSANNTVVVTGNLPRDPEVKESRNGRLYAKFTVAANRGTREKQYTDWVPVIAWGPLAEICEKQLWKGVRVTVTGRYTSNSWKDQNGQNHRSDGVTAESIAVIPSENHQGGYGGSSQQKGNFGQFGSSHPDPERQPPRPKYEQPTLAQAAQQQAPPPPEYTDEEIPF